MKRFLVLAALFCLPAFAHADAETELRVRVALALAAANKPAEPPAPAPPDKPQNVADYFVAYAQAVKEGKPLVVYVRQTSAPVEGCIVCEVNVLFWEVGPTGCVCSVPDGKGEMVYTATSELKGTPTAAQIQTAIKAAQASVKAAGEKEKAAPVPVAGACTGGCGNSCACPATKGVGANCTCPASHRQHSEAPPPPQFFAPARACRT